MPTAYTWIEAISKGSCEPYFKNSRSLTLNSYLTVTLQQNLDFTLLVFVKLKWKQMFIL